MKTLKEVLIRLGELDSYSDGKVPTNLWRAQKKQQAGEPVLRPLLEATTLSNGRNRDADISTEVRAGKRYVLCATKPRGVSTFDRHSTFPKGEWLYFRLAKGTELPAGLAIVKDAFNPRMQATHHTIAPAWDMPEEHFIFLLDRLAESLVLEEINTPHGHAK